MGGEFFEAVDDGFDAGNCVGGSAYGGVGGGVGFGDRVGGGVCHCGDVWGCGLEV